MRERKIWLWLALALVAALVLTPAANADQGTQSCAAGEPTIALSEETVSQAEGPLRQGDEVEIGIKITHPGRPYCFLSDITLQLREPNPDGTPGPLRQIGGTFGIGSGFSMGSSPVSHPYVVNLNPDVFEASLGIHWEATVQDGEGNPRISGVGTGATLNVTHPRAELTVSTDPPSGNTPLTVTHTYLLTNVSLPSAPGEPAPGLIPSGPNGPMDALADENCGPLLYQSGDKPTDGDPVLDPGETWKFTCTTTFGMPGTYPTKPTITGVSDLDGRDWPQVIATSEVAAFGTDLTIDKSHEGDFLAGRDGTYTLRITNSGNVTTSGKVTVIDDLPTGMTAKAISGDGWVCDLPSKSCARSDELASGASYPPITLVVTVGNDPPANVVNVATVTGGGETAYAPSNNVARDPTRIRKPAQPGSAKNRTFKVTKVSALAGGNLKVRVTVPSAGRLWVDDARKPDHVRRATSAAKRSGTVSLVLKPKRSLRRILKRSGKPRKVRVRIAFRTKDPTAVARSLSTVRTVTFRPRSR